MVGLERESGNEEAGLIRRSEMPMVEDWEEEDSAMWNYRELLDFYG
jgi:hypothetical protein